MRHFEEDLSGYISNDLDAGKQIEVEAHLKECESCTRELLRLRELQKLLVGSKDLSPSDDFKKRVLDSVRTPSMTSSKRWIAWLAAAAVVILVVLILKPDQAVKPSVKLSPKIPATKPVETPPHPTVVQDQKPKKILPAEKIKKPEPSQTQEILSPDEVELIANLDALENMDLILNYEDVDHLEDALIDEDTENSE